MADLATVSRSSIESEPRVPLLDRADMTAEQRDLHDHVVAGPRGQMIGPLRAAIHSPELAIRWSQLGEFLRYETCLPPRLTELAIIVTGRRWSAQVEWWVHERAGRDAGLPAEVIAAMLRLDTPVFDEAADLEVYEFARHLHQSGCVPETVYRAITDRWGTRGVVELTALIGYYTMVAMTLNAHHLPVPDGSRPLPLADALCDLPPALHNHVPIVETVPAPVTSPGPSDLPSMACDSHTHAFGPFDRFPPIRRSVYPLPDAGPTAHRATRDALGMQHCVLVQPAPYADDPAAMLAAIATSDGALKGVAVATPTIEDAKLIRWREGGIVGLRFVETRSPNGDRYPGSEPFESLVALAPRLRALGMHAELWARAPQFAEWLPALSTLGVPLVIDHMGQPDPSDDVAAPAFQAILNALAGDNIWVKLVLARVALRPDCADARPFHDALVAARPDRMLWGSDWPYVRLSPPPDAGLMLETFCRWVPDAATRRAILVDNPTRLYGFAGASR